MGPPPYGTHPGSRRPGLPDHNPFERVLCAGLDFGNVGGFNGPMKFEKSPPWLVELFAAQMEGVPAEHRKMFGYPAAEDLIARQPRQ